MNFVLKTLMHSGQNDQNHENKKFFYIVAEKSVCTRLSFKILNFVENIMAQWSQWQKITKIQRFDQILAEKSACNIF